MLKLACSVLLLFAGVRDSFGQDNGTQQMDEFRLPETTKPISYELRFTPEFNGMNSTFNGVANITISVLKMTNVIKLNIKDLTVTNVMVEDVSNKGPSRFVKVSELVNVEKNEQFEIHLQKNVPANRNLLVSIAYNGKIRNDMSGLYLSSYEEGNSTKWLAVTQFEATSARKAFPCYDEPSYKAIFNISVVKQKHHIALSNMPILEITDDENKITDVVKFQSTLPMSSYLVAIYVGEFVPHQNNSELTIYGRREYIDQTSYVSADGMKHLRVLEDYTGIKYMLPKMDLLAIPDFKAGAMENWGMNTYREYFIYLTEDSKTRFKIRSSEVVQHEFTHQWFGDLVTCSWWDYTWLNEGFARYFQYFATKMVKTAWPMEELFVVETHQGALAYDQTPRHPITASVQTPDEIDDIFDSITYSKAAAVLRMLRYLVTEELFKLSLQSYLNDKKESVAKPEDLYSAFDNVLTDKNYEIRSGLTVYEFMTNWTLQSGYPVLNITKNETTNTFSIIQSRFLVNGANEGKTETPLWLVGLTFTTESSKHFNNTKPTVWTDETSDLTVITAPEHSGWYIFNIQSTGFYRVNYDEANWMALSRQLNESHTDIHVLNRAQLIDDAFALARAGHLNYSVPLRLTKYLTKENNIIPWYSAMNSFSHLLERMPRTEQGYANIKDHVSELAGSIYQKLEFLVSSDNTEYSVMSAWEAMANWACKLDNNYCTSKALDYFEKWQRGNKISADIKDAAFCVGVKNSNGSKTFNRMLDLYTKTTSISERMSAESALGCSTNKTLLTQYINHILDGPQGPIKKANYNSVVSAVSATPLGLEVLYEFLSTNLNRLLNELFDGEGTVTHIYSTLASKVTKDSEITKIRDLKDNSTLPASVKSSFDKSFEKVNENLLWFDTYSDGISQWALQNKIEKEQKEKEQKEKEQKEKEEKEKEKRTTSKESSTTVVTQPSETTTPKPSSASSNVYSSFIILQLTVLTLIVKRYILCT